MRERESMCVHMRESVCVRMYFKSLEIVLSLVPRLSLHKCLYFYAPEPGNEARAVWLLGEGGRERVTIFESMASS